MKSNKKETATSALALFIFTTGTTIATRFRLVKRKLKKLNKEQSLLMDLMKAIQIEVFEKARMSMKEYGDAMSQYEERLNKIMEERILFENKKQNLMKFKSRARKLNEERNTLRNTLAEVQKAYITQGKYETRVYENMLKSYSTRLSEVEEKIALMDVKKAKK